MRSRLAYVLLPLALAACVDPDDDASSSGDDLTSVQGLEHTIEFDAFVDVPAGSSDDTVRGAIHRQLKSALGALRERGIGVADRDAQRNLAANTTQRTGLDVVQGGVVVGRIDRVHYHYRDTALVERGRVPPGPSGDGPGGLGETGAGPVDLTLLFGDYVARAAELTPICSDDATAEPSSLWYHFSPGRSTCRTAIRDEQRAIDLERAALTSTQLGARDRDRRFLSARATLVAAAAAPDTWPEYDQLWGFSGNTSRQKLVVYSFFGVDSDEANPRDNGLVEFLRHQRTLRARLPGLRVVATEPHAWLLDFYVDGHKLTGITWDDVERWVIDGTGFPAVVGTDAAKRAALLGQVIEHFSERWIIWQWPVTVRRNGTTREMIVEIRTFYGWEDGSSDARLHARWRYLEAFWHADVFAYTGHSHFGHGPLEPWTYATGNFADRYQVMLVNSCLSFNYYDEDFLAMHPGGSQKLDVVVNGLAAYWNGMGQATASYIAGIVDGEDKKWRDILTGMKVNLSFQSGYDPMRAVNGELDNAFTPAAGAIDLTTR